MPVGSKIRIRLASASTLFPLVLARLLQHHNRNYRGRIILVVKLESKSIGHISLPDSDLHIPFCVLNPCYKNLLRLSSRLRKRRPRPCSTTYLEASGSILYWVGNRHHHGWKAPLFTRCRGSYLDKWKELSSNSGWRKTPRDIKAIIIKKATNTISINPIATHDL